MRVLILSTGTGQGHNSAGLAVQEYLNAQGVDARMVDVMNTGRQKSKVIAGMYNGMVTHIPWLFGLLYATAERIRSPRHRSIIYFLNTLYAKSLLQTIAAWEPDVIVCPHLFSGQAVSHLILKHGLKIPTLGIITDYTCSPFWEDTCLDHCVVAHAVVQAECIEKGMDADKLSAPGMPVSAKFSHRTKREEARAAFGIEKEKVFAIMGGSMGYGKIPHLAAALSQRAPDAQVVAVCGNNAALLAKTKEIPGVLALGYIDNVDLLMDAADVLLTKPGGLSVSEALAKRVPLVITLPIPGGEERNSAVIASLGMAVSAHTVQEAADAAYALLTDNAAQEKMLAAQANMGHAQAAEAIGQRVMQMAPGHADYAEYTMDEASAIA